MKSLNRPGVLLLFSAFLIFSGCTKQNNQLTKTTLATSKNMWCTLSLIANEKGYFKQEGLDVDVKYLEAGRYCMDAVVSGSADFGNVVEVNVGYLGFTGNENVSIIGTIVSSTSSAIVARKSSGISKPEDIKGKRFALSPGTTSDIFANRFLAKYKFSTKDVDLRKIQPLAMQGAVVAKEIDAASTWQPFVYNISKAIGNDAVVFKDPEIYVGYENIAVRRDWATKNTETVKAFLRAIKRAEDFVRNNLDEAQKTISTTINLDLEIVKATWDEYNITLTLNDKTLVNDITAIGKWINQTQEGYKDKALPDYQKYVDRTYLDALASK